MSQTFPRFHTYGKISSCDVGLYRPIGRALIRHLSDFFACHQSHGLRCQSGDRSSLERTKLVEEVQGGSRVLTKTQRTTKNKSSGNAGVQEGEYLQSPKHLRHCSVITSSAAQGGGGSFKNRKPLGEVGCCESRMAERIHWWAKRWLELCFWSGCTGPQVLDVVRCSAVVAVVVVVV